MLKTQEEDADREEIISEFSMMEGPRQYSIRRKNK